MADLSVAFIILVISLRRQYINRTLSIGSSLLDLFGNDKISLPTPVS